MSEQTNVEKAFDLVRKNLELGKSLELDSELADLVSRMSEAEQDEFYTKLGAQARYHEAEAAEHYAQAKEYERRLILRRRADLRHLN